LGRAGDLDPVQNLRREFSAQLQMRKSPRLGSLRASARAWAGRVSGRSDRRLLYALAEATSALVDHCDSLTDRLATQETLLDEFTTILGEEVTRLRAEVDHLRRLSTTPEADNGG
jgi:hypothetical protein